MAEGHLPFRKLSTNFKTLRGQYGLDNDHDRPARRPGPLSLWYGEDERRTEPARW